MSFLPFNVLTFRLRARAAHAAVSALTPQELAGMIQDDIQLLALDETDPDGLRLRRAAKAVEEIARPVRIRRAGEQRPARRLQPPHGVWVVGAILVAL